MKKFMLLIVAVGFLAGISLCQWSLAASGSRTKSTTKKEVWIIIKIDEEYKAIESSRLEDEKKNAKKKYEDELKKWQDERKSNPSAEKPKPTTPKKVPGPTFHTREGAEKYINETLEKGEKSEKGGKKSSH
jgi:hypothetical protein